MNNLISEVERFTHWKNEPSLQDLKSDFNSAVPKQNAQMEKINKWNRLKDASPNKPKVRGRSNIQSKLVRKQAEWRYPSLSEPFLSAQGLFKINPVSWEDERAAKQNELLINYQFRNKLNRVEFIDNLVRSVVDDGTAIVRVGWSRKINKVKEPAYEYSFMALSSEEEQQTLQQAIELKSANPRAYSNLSKELKAAVDYYLETGMPTIATVSNEVIVEVDKIIENHPTCEVLNPRNVYIDPSCTSFDKCMFVVITRETNKADLLKDGNDYINLNRIDWKSVSVSADVNHITSTPIEANFKDETRRKTVVYEYWGYFDINNNGTLEPILAMWIGNTLIYLNKSPFSDGKLPLVIIPYLPNKRELYGESDAEVLQDNQAIQGAVSRGIIDLIGRSANAQRGIAKGMLDSLNRRRYDGGEDYEFNPVNHPSNGIVEHKYPEIPNSALTILSMQGQEAEALTGVKSFSSGISGATYGDVAVGVRGALDASAKREMAILRRIAKGLVDTAAKFISMNADFLSEEEVIRVTNEEYALIKREELIGNFDLITDIATAEVDNNKVQDLAFLLQTLGNNIDAEITMSILAEIAALKRLPELANKIKNYKPAPNPLEEKKAQLEVAKLELELAELQAQTELLKAKALEAKSKADKLDLDYIEQETGTKHARDLDRSAAQARANQDLQITKALTTPKKPDTEGSNIEAAIGYNQLSKADAL